MIWPLELLLFGILIAAAVLAIRTVDLLAGVALMSLYSLVAALLFTGMQALDVTFVEAGLGAGVVGVLLIAAVAASTRHARPHRAWNARSGAVAVAVAGFVGLMLYASTGLPDRGDTAAPASQRVAPAYVEGALADSETPNVVTAILADYRSQDTLGETVVIVTAAAATALILRRRPDEEDEA